MKIKNIDCGDEFELSREELGDLLQMRREWRARKNALTEACRQRSPEELAAMELERQRSTESDRLTV
jgi:hypothetical protein